MAAITCLQYVGTQLEDDLPSFVGLTIEASIVLALGLMLEKTDGEAGGEAGGACCPVRGAP